MRTPKQKQEDPAFLFYPGDASEDTQFMNRLERGCYFDLLKAQKKFRRFTLEQIRRVLGKDFGECWPSIEVVLKREGEFYFIGWVDNSIEKRKEYSNIQSERIQKYWDEKKRKEAESEYRGITDEEPRNNGGETGVIPSVIGNENEIVNTNSSIKNVSKSKSQTKVREVEEKKTGTDEFKWCTKPNGQQTSLPLPEIKVGAIIQLFKFSKNADITESHVQTLWEYFKIKNFDGVKFYQDPSDAISHFFNWAQTPNVTINTIQNAANRTSPDRSGKLGTSDARIETAKKW